MKTKVYAIQVDVTDITPEGIETLKEDINYILGAAYKSAVVLNEKVIELDADDEDYCPITFIN